jgi:inosine-uridine nucleoside N-ribohydrolase
VAGNAALEHTTGNALGVLELAGRGDVPVAAGSSRALVREWVRRDPSVHGERGLGDVELPIPRREAVDAHAADFIAARAAEAPLTLVAVGPLTNVALLLARYEDVTERLERIVVMGGARSAGNITPAAEFNFFVDPEAAFRVFASGVPLTLIDLDLTHQALLEPTDVERIRELGERGELVARLLDFYGRSYERAHGTRIVPLHDGVAVADIVDGRLIETVPARVEVEYAPGPSRGRTLIALEPSDEDANADYGVRIDRDAFVRLLVERLATVLSDS